MSEAACPSSEPDLHLGPAVTAVDVRTDQVSQDVFHDSDRKSVLFFFIQTCLNLTPCSCCMSPYQLSVRASSLNEKLLQQFG